MKIMSARLLLLAAAACLFIAAPARAQGTCDAARRKSGELQQQADAWAKAHQAECTLCSGGSSCREGFERADGVRRLFEEWKRGHVAGGCVPCGPARCGAADLTQGAWWLEASGKHRERCRKCDLDPLKCDGWKLAVDEIKRRMDEWKRDHPSNCDRCAPACEDWKRRASEITLRSDESLKKHKEKCAECARPAPLCDRAGALRAELQRDRLNAWKRHLAECRCTRKT